jgi:hypothetical protein
LDLLIHLRSSEDFTSFIFCPLLNIQKSFVKKIFH